MVFMPYSLNSKDVTQNAAAGVLIHKCVLKALVVHIPYLHSRMMYGVWTNFTPQLVPEVSNLTQLAKSTGVEAVSETVDEASA